MKKQHFSDKVQYKNEKIIAMFLAITICIISFTACGDAGADLPAVQPAVETASYDTAIDDTISDEQISYDLESNDVPIDSDEADEQDEAVTEIVHEYSGPVDEYGLPDINAFLNDNEIDLIEYLWACGANSIYVKVYDEAYSGSTFFDKLDKFSYDILEEGDTVCLEPHFNDWALEITIGQTILEPIDGVVRSCGQMYRFLLPTSESALGSYLNSFEVFVQEPGHTTMVKGISSDKYDKGIYYPCIKVLPKIIYTFNNATLTPGIRPGEIYDYESDYVFEYTETDGFKITRKEFWLGNE